MANDTAVPLNRIERILRNMIASAAGLSIISIIATFIARTSGVDTREGVWLTISVLPFVGFTIALLLIIVFLVVAVLRRRRLAQGDN